MEIDELFVLRDHINELDRMQRYFDSLGDILNENDIDNETSFNKSIFLNIQLMEDQFREMRHRFDSFRQEMNQKYDSVIEEYKNKRKDEQN